MKAWEGVEVQLRPLLFSAVDWGESSASADLSLPPLDWMGRRNCLAALQESASSHPTGIGPRPLVDQLVVLVAIPTELSLLLLFNVKIFGPKWCGCFCIVHSLRIQWQYYSLSSHCPHSACSPPHSLLSLGVVLMLRSRQCLGILAVPSMRFSKRYCLDLCTDVSYIPATFRPCLSHRGLPLWLKQGHLL